MIRDHKQLVKELHEAKTKKEKINAHLGLSEYFYNERDFQKSKKHLNDILEIDPNYVNINYYIALSELSMGDEDSATKHLREELKLNKSSVRTKDLLEKLEINSNFPYVTIVIAFITLAVYILFTHPQISFLYLLKYSVSEFNMSVYTAITSIFFHANFIHFILNFALFLLMGIHLEKYIGSLKFWTIILVSGVVGNFAQAFLLSEGFVLGLSASLFGIFGSIVMREPLLKMKLFGFINVPMIILFGAFFIIEGIISKLFLSDMVAIAEISHIIGFLTGILLTGFFYKETIKVFYNWIAMSLGFFAIVFSINLFIQMPDFSFNEIIVPIVIAVIGGFLIFYSYIKLTYEVKLRQRFHR